MTGSNRRPLACKASALPAELILLKQLNKGSLAASYSHKGQTLTTIGAEELNFRVRDGNGCDLFAIATKQIIVFICSIQWIDNYYYNFLTVVVNSFLNMIFQN